MKHMGVRDGVEWWEVEILAIDVRRHGDGDSGIREAALKMGLVPLRVGWVNEEVAWAQGPKTRTPSRS